MLRVVRTLLKVVLMPKHQRCCCLLMLMLMLLVLLALGFLWRSEDKLVASVSTPLATTELFDRNWKEAGAWVASPKTSTACRSRRIQHIFPKSGS
jgi:hypothetical protein